MVLTFWTCVWDSQQLFTIFRNVLEMMPSQLEFCSWKQETAQGTNQVRMGVTAMFLETCNETAVYMNKGTNSTETSATCSSPPLEFMGIYHMGDLTSQQIIKY
jgi:hypothetical protein